MTIAALPSLGIALAGAPITGRVWRASHLDAIDTLTHMRDTVREDLGTPIVWETADEIVRGISGTDVAAQLAAIYAWLLAHTTFVRDPDGLELLRSPELMLQQIDAHGVAAGDCDDIAMLAAALALAIGCPAQFVAEGYGTGPNPPYEHVYACALGPDGWVHFDVQRPTGVTLPAATKQTTLEV